MIITIFLNIIIFIIGGIFRLLPVVSIASIPYIGSAVSGYLTTAVLTWNAFIATFPYAGIAWNVFIFVILPFEALMLIGKFFLGHRMPSHN